jgi:hypothetical protein
MKGKKPSYCGLYEKLISQPFLVKSVSFVQQPVSHKSKMQGVRAHRHQSAVPYTSHLFSWYRTTECSLEKYNQRLKSKSRHYIAKFSLPPFTSRCLLLVSPLSPLLFLSPSLLTDRTGRGITGPLPRGFQLVSSYVLHANGYERSQAQR